MTKKCSTTIKPVEVFSELSNFAIVRTPRRACQKICRGLETGPLDPAWRSDNEGVWVQSEVGYRKFGRPRTTRLRDYLDHTSVESDTY